MYTIAMLNQKGGVGKTATSIGLGAALAERGYRVLLVDLDPQGHLTEACSIPEADTSGLADAMTSSTPPTPDSVAAMVIPYRERLDVIPTSIDMFLIERELYRSRGPEYRLQRVVDVLDALDTWDVCIIDCPPSLGVLTDNALVAAGQVIIPVQSEDSTLRALRLLLEQITSIRADLRTDVDVLGMVVNLFDRRKGRVVTSVLDALQSMPLDVLAIVPDRAAIREAWRAGEPVLAYSADSDAADAYRALAARLTDTTTVAAAADPEPVA